MPNPRDTYVTQINEYVDKWTKLLGLVPPQWEVKVSFDEQKDKANSTVQPRYRLIRLRFNIGRLIAEGTEHGIEELVLHELVHPYTWRIWEFSEQANPRDEWMLAEIHEEAVTLITWAILRAHRQED